MTTTPSGIFRIPKDPLQVGIRMAGGSQLNGKLFLDFALDDITLHDRIAGFLASDQMFFPFVPDGEHKPVFLNKNILVVLDADMEEGFLEGVLSMVLVKKDSVLVSMTDGAEIKGELLSEVPEDQIRLSDRLNSSGRFIKVMSGTRLRCLNTDYIVRVEEVP